MVDADDETSVGGQRGWKDASVALYKSRGAQSRETVEKRRAARGTPIGSRRRAGLGASETPATRERRRSRARRGRRGSRILIDPSARPCVAAVDRRPPGHGARRGFRFSSWLKTPNETRCVVGRRFRPAADASDESWTRSMRRRREKTRTMVTPFPEVYRRPACVPGAAAKGRSREQSALFAASRQSIECLSGKEPRNRFSARLDECPINARSAIDRRFSRTADAKIRTETSAAARCVAFPRGRRCGTPEQRWRRDREEVVATDIGGARVSPVRARPASASTGGDPARFASGPPRQRCRPSPAEGRRAKRRSR